MKQLNKIPGTIAYILDQNRSDLFDLINKGNIKAVRERSISLVQDASIKDKQAVIDAVSIFKKSNDAVFLSSLMTYLTGLKVS